MHEWMDGCTDVFFPSAPLSCPYHEVIGRVSKPSDCLGVSEKFHYSFFEPHSEGTARVSLYTFSNSGFCYAALF